MKGYVFHYYKYGKLKDETDSSHTYPNKKRQQPKKDEPEDYITFGEYDRVAIAQVDDFTRFRDLSPNTVKWRGKRRSILLYELQEDGYPLRIEAYDGTSCNFGFQFNKTLTQNRDNNPDIKRLFMGLTIITVSDEVRSSENFETFLKNVRKKILNRLDRSDKGANDIEYEVFGTLGSTGIAIIWFADQYSTILSSVEKINKFKVEWDGSSSTEVPKSCFTSLYTLLSKNRIKAEDKEAEKISKISGKGILSFALKKQIGTDAMKNILKKCLTNTETDLKLYHCMGEYDYWCEVEISNIYSKFDTLYDEDPKKQLNSQNEEFRDNILRTKLVLQEDENARDNAQNTNDTENADALDLDSVDTLETDDIITLQGNCPKFAVLYPPSEMGAIFNQLREKLKKLFPHTAGMADTLDLLYSDYQSNYKTNQYIWSPDFSIQFCCVLKHLNCACENLQDNSKDFLDKIRDLTNAFNQQIYHMFDSGNNMYLELPSCHLRYTGQQDMILYAYFGILKDILFYMNEEVTSQKRSYQPRLIPFVTIDVVPIIETDFYPDNSEYDEDRPVILNLPSAALFDLPPHIAYIVHELFHYTTPKNRFTRNKLYLFVYFTEYMVGVVYEALMLFINNQIGTVEKPKEKLLTALSPVIRKSCFHYISQQIDEICDELQIYSHYRETSKKINAFFMLDILMEDVISILDLIAEDPKDDGATPCPGLLKKLRSILSNFFNVSEYQYLELILNEIYNLQNNVLDEEFRCAVKTLENQIKTRKNYVEKTKGVPQKQNNDSKTDEPAESKLFRCVVKKLKQETIYNDTIGVFREVSADIAMVDLCGMDLVEYIFHYVRTKKNMLQDKNTRVLQTKDLLRIGILLDCLIEKNKEGANESHKKQFICRYITHYLKKDGQEKVLENDDTIKNLKKNGQEKVNDLRKEAESWFDYIVANYRAYIQIYTSYRVRLFPDIIKQYTISEMLCQSFIKKYKFKEYRSITQACMDAVGLYLESKGDKQTYAMMVGAKKDYDAKIFELNVSLILQSQKQKYLSDIKPSSKTNAREKDDSKFSEKYKSEIGITPDLKSKPEISRIRKVYSLEELLRAMLECSQDLKGVQKTFYESQIPVVWYRGEESDEWLLLPKLLRMAQEKGDARRLSILQRENMGIFKSICESMDLGAVSAKTDSLSMIINMQHYGVGTNFLDWSEDAMSSLYFALRNTVEPNIDHLEGREWEARRKSFPTIYLFSPLLYNEALREFLQKYLDEKDKAGCRKAPAVEMVENLIDAWERGLPNISLEEYGDIFNPYIAGNIKIEKTLMRQGGDKINPFLPLAILPSRINPRIQAQSGNFIAFNLFAEGEADENNKFCSYAYLNLKKIQEQFIEFFGKTDSDIRKYIFLYQIILASAEAKEEVAAFVKATGMGAERVYPELQNIIEKKFKK